ncbi:Helix-turn-helix type 11 domain protein [Thermobacillus xylanilyticus]|uniref:Helix-turn-helix type 11 domain protein n=2 Tax=Thermobacillus xylanilyticus TaxID=76633 RepID=A0ABM8V768_THEXY|nr:Helix-turn-helix type 11 domain protein [Thermobacillus xylanilyticus]
MEGLLMSKSRRLLELMMAVNRKRRFKVRELAEEFGVSTRTMLRDLQTLSELGVPLYSETGPNGGYQVLRERVIAPIAFTEGEAAAVFFAIHALRHYAELPFEAESASAERKFYLNMPGDIRERIDGMKDRVDFLAPKRRAEAPCLGRLLEAAIRGQALRIEYEAKNGAVELRRIRPALLYADDGFWYCTAYCYEREDYRVFRCDRVRRAEPDGPDLQPLDPDEVREARLGAATAGERIRLRARLTAEGVRRWESKHWLAPMVTVEGDGSGTVDAEVPRGDLPFFAELFVALGSEAEAEGPEELRAEIRRRLAERMERYRE